MLPMKKQVCVCIFIACVFYISIPNTVLGQGIPLAQRVFQKHKQTLQRADIQEVLPAVLEGLKDPNTQPLLNPATINLVVNNPDLLPQFVPDIDPKFVTLLKTDAKLRAMLRDPLMQRLLQQPAAIDELARLLGVGGGASRNLPDLPEQTIYNQAMPSVVWINTIEGNWRGKGSGVLIDKKRRLIVTNEHVIRNAESIDVFFPWRDENGKLNKDEDFYFKNREWLENQGYVSRGRVIVQHVRNDIAIIQLAQLSPTASEIKHDFSRNVEDSMEENDKVYILGNPGERLWNWAEGTFKVPRQTCLPSGGACLEMTGDAERGNSGGPILNRQGMLIGILTAGTDETMVVAAPARNVKTLLNSVPANLTPLPPPRTYPKRTFKIRNQTGVTVHYQIRWSNKENWKPYSFETGFVMTHRSNGQHVPSDYPKIRFDHIAGDQMVTYRSYRLETVQLRENNDNAPTYRFEFNQWGDRLDIFKGVAPTVHPKRTFKIRNQTGVTVLYQIKWSNSDNWKSSSLETGFIITHRSSGQSIPSGYPKIRFDHIAGDGQVTYRVYNLESAIGNTNVAPTYRFQYNRRGDRLDLYRDGFAAPALSREVPKDTVLLSNYPNPFNPETWIPYHLAKPAEVTVTLYAADGRLIRTLALGHQPAGVYQDKSRAVYWDGKNELGEPVASGVYFYTFTAGDFTATRKMLIIR